MSFHHLDKTIPEQSWVAAGVETLGELDKDTFEELGSIIILAAHPDDEALGCAGLLKTAEQKGIPSSVVLFTAGEGSHPDSPTYTAEQLAEVRNDEFKQALAYLNADAATRRLCFKDGQLHQHSSVIQSYVMELVLAVPKPILLAAPLHDDGHSDHEVLGKVARAVGKRTNITVAEYPIWYWHWSTPADSQWKSWQRLLDPPGLDRLLISQYYPSQTTALSEKPGDEPIISQGFLEHFQRGYDTFAISSRASDAYDAAAVFDRVHINQSDPWNLEASAYESRKRASLLNGLSAGYAHTLEIGCSIGILSAELAQRSALVTAVDASSEAIGTARSQQVDENIGFECLTVPFEWPKGSFDLVVLSEVGYYLSEQQFDEVLEKIDNSCQQPFTLALCHMKGVIEGWPLDADKVHQRCEMFWPYGSLAASVETDDYRIDILGIDKPKAQQYTTQANAHVT